MATIKQILGAIEEMKLDIPSSDIVEIEMRQLELLYSTINRNNEIISAYKDKAFSDKAFFINLQKLALKKMNIKEYLR
jgi:hypothetical protein